ncbi:MAG: alcohol dehydrogenase catalytic domain-containing protein [Christensenellaceae bacterium]|nr:alcohol dehydrogenase catalytic domain-containing protein [Christensenellaceae bacterium]
MKALLLKDISKFEYTDVETPLPGPGEIQMNVKACSICGSDVHGYDGSSGRRIPPMIMGHEASGVVSAVGEGVTKFKVGDKIVFNSGWYCRDCYQCKHGLANVCDNGCCYGVQTEDYGRPGALCEYIIVPEYIVYNMPDHMSFPEGALIEPLAIACHGIGGVNIGINDTAVIFGAGVIGLMLLKVLKTSSCGKVYVVELDEVKKKMAEANGGIVIDGREDVPAKIKELTGGIGADFAIEAVGISATVNNALACLKKGGTLVQVGNVSKKVDLPLQTVVMNELKIVGRYCTSTEYETAIALIANGKVDVSDCISVVAPLQDGQQWFDRLHAAEPGLVKVVLEP